jgi:hypothetical protein
MGTESANDFTTILGMFNQYRAAPLVSFAMTLAVILYASHKFGEPTKALRDDQSILPPRQPAVQTTYLRYRLSLTLYVLLWLAFFAAFVFVPPIFILTLELTAKFGAGLIDTGPFRELLQEHRQNLPYILPLLAFVFMYFVAKVPGFSDVEEAIRGELNVLAKIPREALRLSGDLRDRALTIPNAFIQKLGPEAKYQNIRGKQRSLYDAWLRLRYISHQLETWPSHSDYSRFALKYAQERGALLASARKLGEALSTLDHLLDIAAPVVDTEAQRVATDLETLLKDTTTFLCYGVLSSFATRRARQEALECIGFLMGGKPIGEEFPLDSASLALVLVPIFFVIASLSATFAIAPSRFFGGDPSVIDRLTFPGCLRWGFWGMTMHIAAIVAVLMLRRAMSGTALRAWLEAHDESEAPYGMYLFCGAVAFVTGGCIALFASLVGPNPFTWSAFAWGAVTFVTGASIIWHIDESKRVVAARSEEQAGLTLPVMKAKADWRIVLGQGAATASFSMFANLYVLGISGISLVDWKFCAFLLVTNFVVGGFLAHHLRGSFLRRQIRKRVVVRAAETDAREPPPAPPLPGDVLPAAGM